MGFTSFTFANNPREAYLNADLKERTFDKKEWKELVKDLDYSDDREPWKPEEKPLENRKDGSAFSGFFKFLAVILAIVLAVLVILHMIGTENLFAPKDKSIKASLSEIDIEEIEDKIHETELEGYIREAVKNEEYDLAIRLYYLEILKGLSLNECIKWKKDKTNGDYLRELRGSELYSPFRKLTNIFERVWYGKASVDKENFDALEPRFKELINRIGKKN